MRDYWMSGFFAASAIAVAESGTYLPAGVMAWLAGMFFLRARERERR